MDLVGEALARAELDVLGLLEDLRVCQAELEAQRQELSASRLSLQRALSRFTAFFASVPVAGLIVDTKGLILAVNDAAERLFDLRRNHSRDQFLIRLVQQGAREEAIEAMATALGKGRAECLEIGLRTTHGAELIGDLYLAGMPGEPGTPRQLVCAVIDRSGSVRQRRALDQTVAGLRRSQAQLDARIRALSCLYDVLRLSSQPEVPIATVLQQVVDRLPSALHEAGRVGTCIQLPSRVFRSQGFQPSGLLLSVPFAMPGRGEGQLQVSGGALGSGSRSPAVSPDERALLEAVVGHLSNFLKQRAAEEHLARTREHYRIVAECSPEWEYWLGADGRYVYVSPACETITGYAPEEFLTDPGLTARLVHPADRARYLGHRSRILAPGTGSSSTDDERLELRLRTRDGRWIWVDHLCNPVIGSNGRWLGRRGVNRDITPRKRAEAELARVTRLYRTLSATNQAILRHDSVDTLAPELCRVAVELGGLLGCALHRLSGPGGKNEVLAASYRAPMSAHSEPGPVSLPSSAEGLAETLPYGLTFPIRINGTLVACQTVYADEPEFFTPDVVELLDEVGKDLGSALDRFDKEAARVAADRRLRETEERLRLALDATNDGLWDWDIASGRVAVNDRFFTMLGYMPGEYQPTRDTWLEQLHPEDRDRVWQELKPCLARGAPFGMEFRLRRKDGSWRWILGRGKVVSWDASGRASRVVGTHTDITDQHLAEEKLAQAAKVFEGTADGVLVLDRQQRIIAANRAFAGISGYDEAEVLGRTPELLNSGRRRDEILFRSIWAVLARSRSWSGELWSRRKDGELFRARMTISTVVGDDESIRHYIIIIADITSLTQTKEQLDFLAHHDPLTSLPNRTLFRSRLEHGLQRAERDQVGLALMLLDLNRFRVVNESLGHAQGDALLRQVAASLLSALRPGDTLARLAGDEFGLILEDLSDPLEASDMANRVLDLCAVPRTLSDQELLVTASLGISVYPTDGASGETLLRHADAALKRAKQQGPQAFQFYEAAMEAEAVQRLRLESSLRQAMAAGELSLHFQPQVRLADGALIGAECLLRWTSPELGPVPPARFIPLAEEIGLIGELGAWALEQACQQMAEWDRCGWHLPRLAVNISIRELEGDGLERRVREILAGSGVAPDRLELEITESTIMRQAALAQAVLHRLQELGLRLVVDDFGTGYSSLAYLKRLPLQQLKIDKSFVDDLLVDGNSLAIVQAILALGRSLELEILAEGVESPEQAQLLREEGCDFAQGYHFDRPLPAEEFAARWLGSELPRGRGLGPL